MNFESLYNPVDGKIEDAPEDFENLPDASQGEMALPKSDPGFFDGMTDTWKAPLSAGLKSLAGFETSLAETNVVGAGLQMFETETGETIENPEEREKQITARIEEESREHRELAQREYSLDPETSGFAAQMMFGLAETLPKAVGYSILGGPVGGAVGFGVDIGASTYGELRDKGVDKGTAAVAGLTSGALNAIGVWIPATFGKSRAQSATIGALANFGLTGAELAGVSFALASQDYDDLADQYGLNWTSLATSAVFGGVFGGAMYRAPRANAYKPFNEAQRKSVYDSMYEQLKAVGGEYANDDVASTQARLHAVGVENLARKVGLSYEQTMEITPSIVRDDGSLGSAIESFYSSEGLPPIEGSFPAFELIEVATDASGVVHRVYGFNGNPDLAVMPEGVKGLKPLPIRLQESTMAGDHIRKHEGQLKANGYQSVEHAIWDITRNFQWIYKGTKPSAYRLVRPILVKENGKLYKGVIQTELQEVAGVYRIGSVFVSNKTEGFAEANLVWERTPSIRGPLSSDKPTTGLAPTRELTRPEQDRSFTQSIGQEIGVVNSFNQIYQRDSQGKGAYGSYNPSENKIKLTSNANLSTFSHEMGHWYLDTMFKLSGRGSADLDGDVATLLREFGIKSVDVWNKLGVEGQRKYQEQFASWLEVYLSKGEAPKPTLERLFERIKEWILDVYESLGGTQKAVEGRFESEFGTKLPEMSEEVKGVMDRLFAERKTKQKATRATSDQVAAARVVLDDYVRDERLKRILAKVEAGKRISSEDRKYWASVTRAMQVATQQLMEGRPVDVSVQMSDVPLDGKVVAKAQEKFVSEFEKVNTKPAAKNDGTVESAESLVEDSNVESALNDVQEALAQVRNENGEPVFDADAIRQGVDVAKRVVDAIGEVQARIDEVRALDAEHAVQTETVEAKREASRALLGDDGQQVMLHNIGQEMPDMAYEVEDGNGNVVKMTVAEIEAVQSSILEQAEIDKAAMGKAVECVLNNQGI